MTKLVRKLKQMAKKRAHRKTVQKRKLERAQRELEKEQEAAANRLEREVDEEVARLNGNGTDNDEEGSGSQPKGGKGNMSPAMQKMIRVVGGLVLDAPNKKNKKRLSRKQARRQEKLIDRGEAIADQLAKKWDHKKRRVKVRAQIRNEDLHN